MHPEFNYVDLFIVYAALPILAVIGLFGNRMYFKSKQSYFQSTFLKKSNFKLSRNLVLGNIGVGIFLVIINLSIYTYIINIRLFRPYQWELATIFFLTLLTLALGIGIGAHVTSISIKTHLSPNSQELKKNQLFRQALHFFHYPFSHKLPYTAVLLMTYILSLLDLYKGKILQLNPFAYVSVTIAGIGIGLFTTVLFILAKTQKLMLSTVIILLTSIYLVSYNEALSILQHPISLMFTSIYWTILVTLILQKQSKVDIRTPSKKFIKKWFEWDIDVI